MNSLYFISYLHLEGGGSCTMEVEGNIETRKDIVFLQEGIAKKYGMTNVVIMYFKEMPKPSPLTESRGKGK